MYHRQFSGIFAGAAVAATLMTSQTAPAVAQTTRTVTLDAGTVIPVRLRDTISSNDARVGDRFTATLQSEDSARSLRLPVGTFIEGTVSAVRAMQGKDPGVVSLTFDRVVLPNEASYTIKGSLIGLDDKSVTRSSNGRITAKADHKTKPLVYAGYGAGAGLILGALTKGNTILDTLIGGGLGYLLGSLDKTNRGEPKDVVLKPNTEFGVRLDRSLKVREYDDGTDSFSSDRNTYRRNRTDRNGDPIRSDADRTQYDSNGDPIRSDTDRIRYDRNGDPIRSDTDRTRYDRNGDPIRSDAGRDRYDDGTYDNRGSAALGTYDILKQYTDIHDNGEPIEVTVGGRPVSFLSGAHPYISNGVVMVPAMPILRAANARYTYTGNQFVGIGPGESLTGRIDSRFVMGSGTHRFTLPAMIQRRNGTVYVPMQFLAIVTGQRLTFDRTDQIVQLGSSRVTTGRP